MAYMSVVTLFIASLAGSISQIKASRKAILDHRMARHTTDGLKVLDNLVRVFLKSLGDAGDEVRLGENTVSARGSSLVIHQISCQRTQDGAAISPEFRQGLLHFSDVHLQAKNVSQ